MWRSVGSVSVGLVVAGVIGFAGMTTVDMAAAIDEVETYLTSVVSSSVSAAETRASDMTTARADLSATIQSLEVVASVGSPPLGVPVIDDPVTIPGTPPPPADPDVSTAPLPSVSWSLEWVPIPPRETDTPPETTEETPTYVDPPAVTETGGGSTEETSPETVVSTQEYPTEPPSSEIDDPPAP